MITAVDTNVLYDILLRDPRHLGTSRELLDRARLEGALIVCEVVLAELAAALPSGEESAFLRSTGLRLVRSNPEALALAGRKWRDHRAGGPTGLQCNSCGKRTELTCVHCGAGASMRQHLIADFLIGAHGLNHADRLLTRDRRYYATYFPDLTLM